MIAPPPAVDPRFRVRVLGTKLHCRFIPTAKKSLGGIWLPDIARENLTHAEVIAAGPGLCRVPQADFVAGMHVIFPRHSYTPLTKDEISVRMEDVIASVWEDDDGVPWLIPENDWVLIDRVAAEETSAGGVILPETSRRRARKGEIADVGPGLLRLEGEYQGTRAPCPAIMGQENACPEVGALVYWGPDADCPQVALAGRAWWLVKARDLLVVEVHDEEDADDA